jgi:hypothetical protein
MELVKILRDIIVTEGVKNRRSVLELAHETGLPVEEVLQREIDLGLITSISAATERIDKTTSMLGDERQQHLRPNRT